MTITLGGWTLMLILMVIGGYVGWRKGLRAFLTITLVSALAYLLFVIGTTPLIDYVNNLYTNIPKLVAVFTGGDPDTVASWQPLGLDLGLPLPVRVFLFIAFVVIAWIFNKKPNWYSDKTNPQSQQLGIFSGALTALIWTSAVTTFWQEATGGGGGNTTIATILNSLPDVTSVTPWLITMLFIIVVIGVLINLPKLWKP